VKPTELSYQFEIWYKSNYGVKVPPPKDLQSFMDKEYGRRINKKWMGIKIKYDIGEEDQRGGGSDGPEDGTTVGDDSRNTEADEPDDIEL
jgi:hypothetical protein